MFFSEDSFIAELKWSFYVIPGNCSIPWKNESFSGQYEELFSSELKIAKFLVVFEVICSNGLKERLDMSNYEGYYCAISLLFY